MRERRRRRAGLRDQAPRRRVRRGLVIAFGFLIAGVAGAGSYFLPVLSPAVSITGHGGESTHHVVMLSIPRDLWVPIGSGGTAKIDAAYADGGARTAIATVEKNFHVHVDHYVWTGLHGLIALVDAVGGVDVVASNPVMDDFYPRDLDASNPYAFERVAVLPGAQHMSGAQALQYVRSRHGDLREDFGRSERQQQLLLALRAKAKSMSAANLPELASALNGEMTTDMSISQLSAVLPLASDLSLSDVERVILLPPYTHGGQIAGQDVVLPDWSLILPVVAKSFP